MWSLAFLRVGSRIGGMRDDVMFVANVRILAVLIICTTAPPMDEYAKYSAPFYQIQKQYLETFGYLRRYKRSPPISRQDAVFPSACLVSPKALQPDVII